MSDGFAPITGPYFKALQLKAFAESLQAQREERAQRQQLFNLSLEQHRKQSEVQDFNTMMALRSMHALPAEIGASAQGDAAMRAGAGIAPEDFRQVVKTPVGQYRLPSQNDQTQYAAAEARRAGTNKGIEKNAEESINDPNETIDFGPEMGGPMKVPRSKAADVKIKLWNQRHPKEVADPPQVNDAGDVTHVWRNPITHQETYRFVDKGAGKSARALAAGAHPYIPNYTEEADKLAAAWRPGVYNQFGVTDDVLRLANAPPGDTKSERAQQALAVKRKRDADAALQKRIDTELQNRARAPQSRTAGAAIGGGQPYTGQSIAQANVQRAAAIKKMTSAEFVKQWQAGGGTITP